MPPVLPRGSFFAPSATEAEHTFHPYSPMTLAAKATAQSAGVGLLVSAVQNALQTCVHRSLPVSVCLLPLLK